MKLSYTRRPSKTSAWTRQITDFPLPSSSTALLQATPALGFGPGGGGAYSGFGGSGSGSGSFSGGFGGGGGFGDGADGYLGFDVDAAERRRTAHGILAAVAFVLLFPLGAVALRVLPSSSGRLGFWAHVGAQMAGWVVYIVAAVLGILLVKEVNIPGEGSLVSFFSFFFFFFLFRSPEVLILHGLGAWVDVHGLC